MPLTFNCSWSKFSVSGCLLIGLMWSLFSVADTKTLTIVGGADLTTGGTLTLDESAEVDIAVSSDGITITLPEVDIRLRCLGDVVDDTCYLAAGSSSSSLVDSDLDGVPDQVDSCGRMNQQYVNRYGCSVDDCNTLTSVGPPACALRKVVTVSVGANGSISPTGEQRIVSGGTASFTVTPASGFITAQVGGTCPTGGFSGSTYTTGTITADCSVSFTFVESSTANYCTNAPSDVICDPDADGNYLSPGGNLDDWREKTGGYSGAPVPARKILALPFTANAAGTKGILSIGNNTSGFQDGNQVKGWFSETPGGPILNNQDRWCRFYSNNPNPKEIKWSQEASVGNFTCDLGQTERVLYFNMEVACYEAYVTSTSTCTVGQRFNEQWFFSIGNI